MAIKSIKYAPIEQLVLQHPEISEKFERIMSEYGDAAPPVLNMHFRNTFEEYGFNYHRQGYRPKEIITRIRENFWNEPECHTCGTMITENL